MKLILSRKGFDSTYGRVPSPIMPDESLCSLPIPWEDQLKFGDISYNKDINLGEIVGHLTKGRINANDHAHLDPDLRKDALARLPGWLPMFGQEGVAQSHLKKNGVGKGDIFLFFGWFRQTRRIEGKLAYETGARDRHVLFGWLQVDEIYKPTVEKNKVPIWAARHPHVAGTDYRACNNTLYIATPHLSIPGMDGSLPGGGIFKRFGPRLCLTAEGKTRSVWSLPRWFCPVNGKPSLTYHSNPQKWHPNGADVHLNTVGRGQEFVLDCNFYPEAEVMGWLQKIFAQA